MRRLVLAWSVLVCVCCSGVSAPTSSTTATTASTVATSAPSTTVPSTTTTAPPPPCPPAPYELAELPPAVVAASDDTVDEPDEFTSMGGTNTRLWVNGEGEVAIALIRGTLPPDQFPAGRGEVDVAGSRGVVGPYPDGRWVAAWFNEPGDRCDQYTLVFHPPVLPEEVEATISAMTRTPG